MAASVKRTLAATLLTTALLLIALEGRFPYYFLQDDGLEYYLPVYVHNWRALTLGELPLYNFHTFAGVPHASMGQPGVFYLPQYFAISLSELIWRHPFAALDLLGIMNGLLAVAGGFLLLRQLRVTSLAAAFFGLSALSGFFLWFGRMWFTTTMLCAWFPWMVWSSLRYLEKPQWSRAAWVLATRIALLSVGHSQYFALAMVFDQLFAITWLLATRPLQWRSLFARYLALNLATVLLGLPILLPLGAEVERSLLRSNPLPYAMFSALSSNPLAWITGQLLVFTPVPKTAEIFQRSMPFLSHIGYLPALLPLGVLFVWRKHRGQRVVLAASVIFFAAALLWSWNTAGSLIYQLPILNRFRFPFKLIYFAGFFQCLLASLVLGHLRRRWQYTALTLFVLNWVWVFLFLPNHAWRIHEYHPPLISPWQSALAGGRYLTVSENPVFCGQHCSEPNQFVELNYSLLWGLDNLFGYEPMASRLTGRIAYGNLHTGTYEGSADELSMDKLKLWSVRYLLVSPNRSYFSPKLGAGGFERLAIQEGWTLWEDPHVAPRVRWANASGENSRTRGIHWTEHTNSIEVNLTEWPDTQLTLAFAANPGLQICQGNTCNAISDSSDGLIHASVSRGQRHFRIVYRNALYLPAISIAVLTALSLAVLARSSNRKCSKVIES